MKSATKPFLLIVVAICLYAIAHTKQCSAASDRLSDIQESTSDTMLISSTSSDTNKSGFDSGILIGRESRSGEIIDIRNGLEIKDSLENALQTKTPADEKAGISDNEIINKLKGVQKGSETSGDDDKQIPEIQGHYESEYERWARMMRELSDNISRDMEMIRPVIELLAQETFQASPDRDKLIEIFRKYGGPISFSYFTDSYRADNATAYMDPATIEMLGTAFVWAIKNLGYDGSLTLEDGTKMYLATYPDRIVAVITKDNWTITMGYKIFDGGIGVDPIVEMRRVFQDMNPVSPTSGRKLKLSQGIIDSGDSDDKPSPDKNSVKIYEGSSKAENDKSKNDAKNMIPKYVPKDDSPDKDKQAADQSIAAKETSGPKPANDARQDKSVFKENGASIDTTPKSETIRPEFSEEVKKDYLVTEQPAIDVRSNYVKDELTNVKQALNEIFERISTEEAGANYVVIDGQISAIILLQSAQAENKGGAPEEEESIG